MPGLKQAFTALTRRPALALAIVTMLGIGIASVTVMFALFDAVLLRDLPYPKPDQLVRVWNRPADPALGGSVDSRWWVSNPDFEDYRRGQSAFEKLAGFTDVNIVVRTEGGRPRRVDAARVSASWFELLGAMPEHGRVFHREEDAWAAEPVVVLDAAFATELGIGPETVGKALIALDGVAHRVVGILPAAFDLPRDTRFWVPLAQNTGKDNRGQHRIQVIGRLKAGASIEAAEAQLATVAARLAEQYPDSNLNRSVWLEPLRASMSGPYRGVMSLLLAACLLLMLVVAANVAGLLMVQAIRRRREVAIRRSLGATRRRLISQFLGEAMLLGTAGALFAIGIAAAALATASSWMPADLPLPPTIGIDPVIFAVALATGLLASIGFGILPALRALRASSVSDLKSGSAELHHRNPRLGVGGLLLVVQMGLAFALVAGAMVLLRTAHGLLTEPLGFEAEDRVAFRIYLPASTYHPIEQPLKVNAYYRELLEGVRALPAVERAAVASIHPLEPNWSTSYWIEGREPPAGGVLPEARFRPVGPDYFRAAGIPLLSGRGIRDSDDFDAAGVVVINQAFARLHFGEADPVGQFLTKSAWWEERTSERWQIVGVAGDVHFDGPGTAAAPAMYFSQAQWPLEDRYLLIEAAGDPGAVVGPVQEILWSIDPEVPADTMTFLESGRAELLRDRLLATTLVGLFAVIVVLVAVAGLYAVLSFAVGSERRQIGIRLAIGAQPTSILVRYLGRGMVLVAAGGGSGILLFLLMRRVAETVSTELQASGVSIVLASGTVFAIVAVLGAIVPARRAAKLSPMEVLREE